MMALYVALIGEARRRYTDGDDALEGALNLRPNLLHSDALARALADELERAYSVDSAKTREINLLTAENRRLSGSLNARTEGGSDRE